MKSQFTPGPWHLERKQKRTSSRSVYEHGESFKVCAYDPSQFGLATVDGPSNFDMQGTMRANARLICAAPELLAALETLTEWMLSHTGPADGTREMLITAKDVITKAKGE